MCITACLFQEIFKKVAKTLIIIVVFYLCYEVSWLKPEARGLFRTRIWFI